MAGLCPAIRFLLAYFQKIKGAADRHIGCAQSVTGQARGEGERMADRHDKPRRLPLFLFGWCG
jgi:hypothetical protein